MNSIPVFDIIHDSATSKKAINNEPIFILDINSMCNNKDIVINSIMESVLTYAKNYNFNNHRSIHLFFFSNDIMHIKLQNIIDNRDVYDRIVLELQNQKYTNETRNNDFTYIFNYIFNNFDKKRIYNIILISNGTSNLIEEERITNFFNNNWRMAYNLVVIGIGFLCNKLKNMTLQFVHGESCDIVTNENLKNIKDWHISTHCKSCESFKWCIKNNFYCRSCCCSSTYPNIDADFESKSIYYDALLKTNNLVCSNNKCKKKISDIICNINFLTKITSCSGAIISTYCSVGDSSANVINIMQNFIDTLDDLSFTISSYILKTNYTNYELDYKIRYVLSSNNNCLVQTPYGYYLFTPEWAIQIQKQNHLPNFLRLHTFTSVREIINNDNPKRNYKIHNELNPFTAKESIASIPIKNLKIICSEHIIKPISNNIYILVHDISKI